jgi:hypothetical protein
MSKPNKTVLTARRKMGGFPWKPRKPDDFMNWLGEKALAGVSYASLEEARAAYEKSLKKR